MLKKIKGREKHKFSGSGNLAVLTWLSSSFCVLPEFLNQLQNEGGRGDSIPNESLAKMLEDAQRMVKEMENRNFTPQKTAAEKERDEAKKCKINYASYS